ncbi:MAG: molybdenum cofactor guanylyltransferase MobA, partial [Dokdonella sp.]
MKRDPSGDSLVTVAILAGGRAERLGGIDKGLHALDGKPLIETLLARVREQHRCEVMIVANRNIEGYRQYASTISDRVAGFAGPLAGIAAALEACTTPWLAMLPVDCPAPPPDLIPRLLAGAIVQRTSMAVAHDGQRRQPLFAICSRDLASDAGRAAADGDGVWRWQDRHGAVEIDFADRRAHFDNLNSAVDFDRYESRL